MAGRGRESSELMQLELAHPEPGGWSVVVEKHAREQLSEKKKRCGTCSAAIAFDLEKKKKFVGRAPCFPPFVVS